MLTTVKGGEKVQKNIQKKLTFLAITLVLALAAMGAASAADTPENSTIVDPVMATNQSSNSSEVINQTLPDPRIEHNGVMGTTIYPTIQMAIDSAQSGDTIWLEENGVFHEYINVWKNLNFKVFNGGQATITGDGIRRVMLIQPGVTATFENITITNGRQYEAAGIINYGTLTLNNCAVTNNYAYGNEAGGIYNGGAMTLNNCVISNNYANHYAGGIWNNYGCTLTLNNCVVNNNRALEFGAGILNFRGTVNINNCNLTNNEATIDYNYYYGGGALFNYYGTLRVYGSNLLNNHAYNAGAVYSTTNDVIMNFNRIVGNTQHTPYQVYSESYNINAEYNWWGSNSNPSASLYRTDADPWLVLTISADSPITNGDTSTVTVDLTHTNYGLLAPGTVPDGTPVTFGFMSGSGPFGSLAFPLARTTTGGVASIVFTANDPAAPHSQVITGTVDYHTGLASVLINPDVDLSITKTADQASYNVGNTVTYTITVSNSGLNPATGVVVTDTLPAGLTIINADGGSVAGNIITWNIASIMAGGQQILTLTATVDTGTQGQTLINTVTTGCSEDNEAHTATASIYVNNAPLQVTKTADQDTKNVDDTVTYTINVTNLSQQDAATNVVVTDTLPAGLTFVSATDGGVWDANTRTVTWNLANLTAGASFAPTVTATVTGEAAGKTLVNTATVDSAQLDDQVSAQASIYVPSADLVLTKTVDKTQPTVKDTVIFTLIVNNNGPDTAVDVTVNDKLPAGLSYVSHVANYGTYDPATGLWTISSLPNGASGILAITAVVEESGRIVNQANVTALTWDPNLEGNAASAALDVQAKPVPVNGKTVAMQKTGAPFVGLLLAFFMLLVGMVLPKRK